MELPVGELLRFYYRAGKSVRNAANNSRRLKNQSRYEEVKEFLLDFFESSDIHFYGSRMSGNANHYSDLDIYVNSEDYSFASGISQNKCRVMIKLVIEAANADPNWTVNYPLYDAKIPVLRCFYIPRRLSCKKNASQPSIKAH